MNQTAAVAGTAAMLSAVKATAIPRIWWVRLFSFCFIVFLASHGQNYPTDSEFSFLVSESILRHGTPALNGFIIPRLDPQKLPSPLIPGIWRPYYQLMHVNGKILYVYPHGSSILPLPFVALLNLCGLRAADRDGVFQVLREGRMQQLVAAFLMAAVICVFLASAALLLSLRASLAIALVAAFGTPIWSSASRTVWSNTWEIMLAGCAVLMLLCVAAQRDPLHPALLATVMLWAYFVRPTGALMVLGVTAYVIFEHRSAFLVYAVTGFAWLCGFLVYWWLTFGQLLPDYYRQGSSLNLANFGVGLAGVLISPSRGLFLFVPGAIIPLYLVIRYRRDLSSTPLVLTATAIIVANVLMIASWLAWWGGVTFGPRLLSDTIPWFVLLTILGWRAREISHSRMASRSPLHNGDRGFIAVTAALLALISVAINGWGANSLEPLRWNGKMDFYEHPERLWDWGSPQFLAGLISDNSPRSAPRR